MTGSIGIRRETKDKTQRRAPLSPDHVRELMRRHRVRTYVEPWSRRVFSDNDYRNAGAVLTSDLSRCNIIFGVKELDPSVLQKQMTYCCFSHTIKGQPYNMPLLKQMLEHRVTLFDYELVTGEDGKRLLYFGDFAGYAGMIDSLWALGRRLSWEGIRNPFTRVRYTTAYENLHEAKTDLSRIGEVIRTHGLPAEVVPFVCGFTGYGRVSSAAQELFDLLPTKEIEPGRLRQFLRSGRFSDRVMYKVAFRKGDMFRHKKARRVFDPVHFQQHPAEYTSQFERYVPHLSMIINGIYWEPGFPRLLTKRFMRSLFRKEKTPRLKVIGDITCDIDGSIELTVKETDSTNPVYVFEPLSERVLDGWEGRGPVVLAVDKLPAELPGEASESFGNALLPFVPELASARFSRTFSRVMIPEEFKRAMIVHRGRLRPKFSYLKKLIP